MEPWDSNYGPASDHRMDEEKIWNFPLGSLGVEHIDNEWITDPQRAMKRSYQPWWSPKLKAPDYVTEEKFQNMMF
jgi:hypothetical protein